MAVKIIRQGKLPEEIQYEADCGYCKTTFSFVGADARYQSDQRDGDYYTIGCPLCTKQVTVAVKGV